MNLDFNQNFFSLFGMTPAFNLDAARLDQAYRDIQSQVHPDRFAHLPETERRLSLQWATRVNEAYRTLRDPLPRARYLLSLQGVDTGEENNTAMSATFLMEQMEWREAVAEARAARDLAELEKLLLRLQAQEQKTFDELQAELDQRHDYAQARGTVRRLMFSEKLRHDIADAIEALEP